MWAWKSCRKRTTEKLGPNERTIDEERVKDVSGALERARKQSAKEMGTKGCKDSQKKGGDGKTARKGSGGGSEITGVHNQPGIQKKKVFTFH